MQPRHPAIRRWLMLSVWVNLLAVGVAVHWIVEVAPNPSAEGWGFLPVIVIALFVLVGLGAVGIAIWLARLQRRDWLDSRELEVEEP